MSAPFRAFSLSLSLSPIFHSAATFFYRISSSSFYFQFGYMTSSAERHRKFIRQLLLCSFIARLGSAARGRQQMITRWRQRSRERFSSFCLGTMLSILRKMMCSVGTQLRTSCACDLARLRNAKLVFIRRPCLGCGAVLSLSRRRAAAALIAALASGHSRLAHSLALSLPIAT